MITHLEGANAAAATPQEQENQKRPDARMLPLPLFFSRRGIHTARIYVYTYAADGRILRGTHERNGRNDDNDDDNKIPVRN